MNWNQKQKLPPDIPGGSFLQSYTKRALRYRRERRICARTKSCDHVYRLVIDWDEYIDFCFSRNNINVLL